jgi:competence protein ComEC
MMISVTILFAFSGAAGLAAKTRSGGWRWVLGVLAISILLAIAVVRPIATVSSIPANWRIFACDVGQGDGVVVRGDKGIALIDTGFDAHKISSCLDTLGIRQIDLLVLTHDDNDHVGGLSGIIRRVRTAVVAPATLKSPKNRPILDALAEQRVHTVIAHRGTHGSLGDTNWQVIWPLEGRVPATPNDSSLTVRIDTPELSALFLGDLGEQAQRDLMRVEQPSPVDVVKVSHHGSSDQFAGLYQAIHAEYGIISVGVDNGYGHPTAKLLKILTHAGTTPLRTDLGGALAIARDASGKWMLWSGTPLG